MIDGQLCFTFNEAEALLENIYVVEPVEEDVIQAVVKRTKKKGKRKEDLSSLPVRDHLPYLQRKNLQISSERTVGNSFQTRRICG